MTYALAHNGGISQINLWVPSFSGDFAFIDLCKMATTWISNDVNLLPANFDANGYNHTNPGYYKTFNAPSQSERPGNYILKWDGGGAVSIGGTGVTRLSGDASVTAGNSGRAVYEVTDGALTLLVSAVANPGGAAGDYPVNIRVCHEDDEAILDAGEMFSPTFKDNLRNIGVIRFIDWQNINISGLMRWEDQMPEAHHSYAAGYWKNYAGFTTNTGDAYSVGAAGGVLTDGTQIMVTFNATSSGYTPTLNWRNTGAIQIVTPWGDPLFADTLKPTLGRNGLMTYNAALNVWLKYGGDTDRFEGGILGVPISIITRLCAEVGAHPWVHIPMYAADPMTNFTEEMATYLKTFAEANATWMKPIYEPQNEIWNSSPGFWGTRLGWNLEDLRIGSDDNFDDHNWYGRVLAKVGKTVSGVYGDDRTKYDVYCGTQAFGSTSNSVPRLTSARYLTEPGIVAGDAARYWTTKGGCTNYWLSSYSVAEAEVFASGYLAMTTAEKQAAVERYVESEEGTIATGGYQTVIDIMQTWNTWFNGYSITFMPYEGGYSVDPYGTGTADLDQLQLDSYFSRSVYYLTQRQFNEIYDMGGVYPSLYVFSGANVWSAHNPTIHSTPSSEWGAIVDYSDDQRRFRMQMSLLISEGEGDLEPEPAPPSPGGSGKGKGKGNGPKRGLITATPRLTWSKKKSTSAVAQVTEAVQQIAKVYPQYKMDFAEEWRHIANLLLVDNTIAQLRKIESAKELADRIAKVIEEDDEEVLLLM